MVEATIRPSYEAWQERARQLLHAGIPPEQVFWTEIGAEGLFSAAPEPLPQAGGRTIRVPRRFIETARLAACHRASERWAVLYRILWRLAGGERGLLDQLADPDVQRFDALARHVQRDLHRMQAFVRFRRIGREQSELFVGWYAPDHDIAALAAPYFAARYPNLRWSIFTPHASIHHSSGSWTLGPGVPRNALPAEDSDESAERLWRAYYAAAFNPARVNPGKLRRDMPVRFRAGLPEAAEIPGLIAAAGHQVRALRSRTGGVTNRLVVPATLDLRELRRAAAECRSCELCERATQTVFGEGGPSRLVLVGEQPGDEEDRAGQPFVGPAGEVLARALLAAGLDRTGLYLTNAVKHFAWEPRGKRRIHRTPRMSEVQACRPWLEAELAACAPDVVLCLGGTAARALLGPQARVQELRGSILTTAFARALLVTYHPSAVLRARADEERAALFDALVTDLRAASRLLASGAGAPASAAG